MAKIGVILLALGGIVTVGLVGLVMAGQPVGLGTFSLDVNGELVMLDVGLLGLGAAALALRPARRMADPFSRASFALLAMGCLSQILSGLEAVRLGGSDPLGDWAAVILGLLGLALFPVGSVLVVVALIRGAIHGRDAA